MRKNKKTLIYLGGLLVLATGIMAPPSVNAITGNHQVIVAYYPIFGPGTARWYTPENCLFIGDINLQYPLLGLYTNTTDTNVITFDFGNMKNIGATVVNPHFFGSSVDTALCDRINTAAAAVGIKWTPTFEAFTNNASGMANITNAFLASYGSSANLMKVNNRPVMFWRLQGDTITENAIASAVETVRANSGQVMIILDSQCLGQPNQTCPPGNGSVSQWFKDPDGSTGYQRINGFYTWTPVGWCMNTVSNRRTYVSNFVNKCVSEGMIPVICTSPSWNAENWGYGEEGDNCGIPGDLTGMPRYNTSRSLTEWESNLNDLFYNNHANAWMYIQAYDEWGEGTTLAPTTSGCYNWLSKVRTVLQNKGWINELACYCRPGYPSGYNPSGCTSTPLCSSGSCSGGSSVADGGSTSGVFATYQAEGGGHGHLTGFATANGWRAVTNCAHDTYLTFGPYATNIPTGNQTARFWLSVDNNSADNSPIARVEVNNATTGTVLAQRVINRQEWNATNIYRPFDLAFTNATAGQQLEFRVYYVWYSQLDHDKTEILGNTLATFQGSSGFYHQCGALTGTDDWRVTVATNNCYMAYGPYTTALPGGALKAKFYLRVDNNTADNAQICQIDVYDVTSGVRKAGPTTITRQQFSQANVYQAFNLNFTNVAGHTMEFRTFYIWYSQLDLDKVEIVPQ